MFIVVGWKSRYCDDATGFMYCPACLTRKPAAMGVRKTYATTFFIPLFPIAEHEAYYRCEGCQGLFNPDARWVYDFGDHASPKMWPCGQCGSSNPSHTYRCERCDSSA
jgi:hypothetical protein